MNWRSYRTIVFYAASVQPDEFALTINSLRHHMRCRIKWLKVVAQTVSKGTYFFQTKRGYASFFLAKTHRISYFDARQ